MNDMTDNYQSQPEDTPRQVESSLAQDLIKSAGVLARLYPLRVAVFSSVAVVVAATVGVRAMKKGQAGTRRIDDA